MDKSMFLSPTSNNKSRKFASDFWSKIKPKTKKQEAYVLEPDRLHGRTFGSNSAPTSHTSKPTTQRFLTLAFGKIETVRALPDTFAELDAIARDWINPTPNTSFSLRVPVEYASVHATRLVTSPYVYLTGEESFQIATMYVENIKIEIVTDSRPPQDILSPPGRIRLSLVSETGTNSNLKLPPMAWGGDDSDDGVHAARQSVLKNDLVAPLLDKINLMLKEQEEEISGVLELQEREITAMHREQEAEEALRAAFLYSSINGQTPLVALSSEHSSAKSIWPSDSPPGLKEHLIWNEVEDPKDSSETVRYTAPSLSNATLANVVSAVSNSNSLIIESPEDGRTFGPVNSESVDATELSFRLLCQWFTVVLADQSRYRTLLAFRTAKAQRTLDVIQMLLDDPRLEDVHLRKGLLSGLVRLSKNAVLYPKCYTLKDVERGSEAVASGHFGEIWKGELEGRKVCLKMVKVFQKSQVVHLLKAFCKEAIIWKHLSHPNVLPFYGIYHLEDLHNRVCLVSPWMENGNVIDFLERNPSAVRLLLISDILEGISYLHDENIVHGDIKGVNVVVTESGTACLADFGLSSLIDADILRWTSVATTVNASGTVRWQAQELFDSEDEDIKPTKASDIYSFSCTCYEIFTERIPYHEITRDAQVIRKVMQGGRPSCPSESSMENSLYHERGMTSIMWELMEECWHQDPAMRPTAKQALLRLPFKMAREDAQKDSNILSPFEFLSMTRIPVHISADEVAEIISMVG